jgi:hypothetical protein
VIPSNFSLEDPFYFTENCPSFKLDFKQAFVLVVLKWEFYFPFLELTKNVYLLKAVCAVANIFLEVDLLFVALFDRDYLRAVVNS